MCTALITNFIISLISGIIAGLIIICWQKLKHKKKLRKICEPLVGTYAVLNIQTEKIEDGAKVHISYKLNNVIETIGITNEFGEWKGRIVIDEHSPDWGSGFYRYNKLGPQGNENGLHKAIFDRENQRIYINIITFTHDKQKQEALIWKKIL